MKRILIATFLLAAATATTAFGQYRDSYGNAGYGGGGYDPYYDDGYDPEGYRAPAPPPPPVYVRHRPAMPGPGYVWIDPCWSYRQGRYVWVNGYWSRPPYAGGYWMAPRYSGGRFFAGFWSGGRHGAGVGFTYRNPGPSRGRGNVYGYGRRR